MTAEKIPHAIEESGKLATLQIGPMALRTVGGVDLCPLFVILTQDKWRRQHGQDQAEENAVGNRIWSRRGKHKARITVSEQACLPSSCKFNPDKGHNCSACLSGLFPNENPFSLPLHKGFLEFCPELPQVLCGHARLSLDFFQQFQRQRFLFRADGSKSQGREGQRMVGLG